MEDASDCTLGLYHLKAAVKLSHFSRHDLVNFKAKYSIFLDMSHVSMKLRVLQRFVENSDSFLSTTENWFVCVAHDRISTLGVFSRLGSISKSRSVRLKLSTQYFDI